VVTGISPAINQKYGARVAAVASKYSYFDMAFLMLLPTIINLPAVLGGGGRFLSAAVLWILFVKNISLAQLGSAAVVAHLRRFSSSYWGSRNALLPLLLCLVMLVLFSDIRGYFTGVASPVAYLGQFFWMVSIAFFAYSAIARARTPQHIEAMVLSLALGFALLLACNLAMVAAGVHSQQGALEAGPNKLLSIVGINISRIRSPLSGGLNNFAAVSALTFVMAVGIIFSRKGIARYAGTLSALMGLACMVLADSRAVIAASMLALLIGFACVRKRSLRKIAPKLIYLLPLFPILFVWLIPILQDSGALAWLQREGRFAEKLGIASGREVIWGGIFDVAKTFNPIQIVGYGTYGQVVSGATRDYAWIFSETIASTSQSPHNAVLQIFIDLGYVGLFVWLVWLNKIVAGLMSCMDASDAGQSSVPKSAIYSLALGFLFIVLGGMTESAGTIYFPDVFCYMIILTMWLVRFSVLTADGKRLASVY